VAAPFTENEHKQDN